MRRHPWSTSALLAFAILFYGLFLFISGNYNWEIAPAVFKHGSEILQFRIVGCFVLLVCSLAILFAYTELPLWVYLIVGFVPFEFSEPFLVLPRLTPLDYICAAAIAGLLIKLPWTILWRHLLRIFGPMGLLLWFLFFLESVVASHYQHGQLKGTFRWIGFLFCYFVGALAVEEDARLPWVLAGLLSLLGTLSAAWGIRGLIKWHSYIQMQALFGEHNILAAFLSLCLPPMWGYADSRAGKTLRIIYRSLFVFVSIGFILAYSRGAWAGMVVGFLIVAILNHMDKRQVMATKLSTWIGLVLFGVLLFFVVRQPSDRALFSSSQRLIYLQTGLRIWRDYPWLGLGPGNYIVGVKSYLAGDALALYKLNDAGQLQGFWIHLHNMYLQILVEHGLIGFILWMGGLSLMVFRAIQALRSFPMSERSMKSMYLISIVAFLVHNCVDIVKVNSLDMVFGIFLAIVTFPRAASIATLGKSTDTL